MCGDSVLIHKVTAKYWCMKVKMRILNSVATTCAGKFRVCCGRLNYAIGSLYKTAPWQSCLECINEWTRITADSADQFFGSLWNEYGNVHCLPGEWQLCLWFAGLGIAVLCIGLALRILASFLSVFGLGFNLKEKLFIPIAWLPKATVQVGVSALCIAFTVYLYI